MITRQTQIDPHGCFTACVSMITGIDQELLPLAPPVFHDSPSPHYDETDDAEDWVHATIAAGKGSVPTATLERCVGIDQWRNLLADNGFQLRTHDHVPSGPAIWPVTLGSHVVIRLPSGEVIDSSNKIDPAKPPIYIGPAYFITIEAIL